MTGNSRQFPLTARPTREGTVLIVTMWLLAVLAGLTVAMAATMRVEAVCSANATSQRQAEAIEAGAVQYVLAHLGQVQGRAPTDAEMPCEAIRVGDGAFWIVRPNLEDDQTMAYGLVDEAGKMNLNTAGAGMMTRLMPTPQAPAMTVEMAASVRDWVDSDDTVTQGGAESEYYLLLGDPYRCKNSTLETLEELLLVKGFTREVLYGEDANRNGVLDAGEDTDGDGELDRGLAAYATVWSAEPGTDASGAARTNVNQPSQALTDLINQNLSSARAAIVRDRIRFGRPFRNLLDFYFKSGMTVQEFDLIGDKLTTRSGGTARGLINVATAPHEVLATLPGLTDADAASLIAKRTATGTKLESLSWVAQALSRPKAVGIGDRITLRSYQFSADIVSVAGNGRAFRRCQVVVDTQRSPARVIVRRNLTPLGWPLDEEIQARLRAGVSIDIVTARQETIKTSNP